MLTAPGLWRYNDNVVANRTPGVMHNVTVTVKVSANVSFRGTNVVKI